MRLYWHFTCIYLYLVELFNCLEWKCVCSCVLWPEFEAMFQFPTDLPHPDHFTPSNKTYPSQNPGRKGSANGQ